MSEAREGGYTRMLLETLPSTSAARALYNSLGFVETEAYRFDPIAGTQFLMFDL